MNQLKLNLIVFNTLRGYHLSDINNKREIYDYDDKVGSDRISELPESVLHHILCFLSPKKAVQTCVLSKSWRHLGPTRPVIDLRGSCYRHVRGINGVCENCFDGNNEAFLSVLDNTFQRYHDQNLSTLELRLEQLRLDSNSISVLEKWIPIMFVKPNASVNAFRISYDPHFKNFDLPSVVFKVESLRELHLKGWRLNEDINSIDNLMLNNLQKLSFYNVIVSDEALGKIVAGCPLVKSVLLKYCSGFKNINIGSQNCCLNRFEFYCSYTTKIQHSIEIDASTLESIRIDGYTNWYPKNSNCFPHLKCLFLSHVTLSTDSFHYFSCNFPCLQELSVVFCSGFGEINLSSRSINRIFINQTLFSSAEKIAIEVTNILYFKLSSCLFPTTLSLASTSRDRISHLNIDQALHCYANDVLPRILLKLFGLVKAVSQSQISLTLCVTLYVKLDKIEWDFNDHPIVVQHLDLKFSKLCPDSLKQFLNVLLRIFRPRYMEVKSASSYKDTAEFLWNTLIHEREKTEYGWEQHLEEVSIEASDEKGEVWSQVPWTCFPDQWSKNQNIRFRLKWSD